MSGFSSEWLALREPHDTRARNAGVLGAVRSYFSDAASLNVVDLGCGTGSTLRAVSPHLSASQRWRLIDNDPDLLARACELAAQQKLDATAIQLDLNRDPADILDGSIDLVTTSALLDLVSADWLARLARYIAQRKIPFYAALTYDGLIELSPPDAFDAEIVAAMNAHQHTDKGFGPALGPSAADVAIRQFEACGCTVMHGRSDWEIGPTERRMQAEVLAGWAVAALQMKPEKNAEIENWLMRRRAAIDEGTASMRIGHVDFFAAPMRTR